MRVHWQLPSKLKNTPDPIVQSLISFNAQTASTPSTNVSPLLKWHGVEKDKNNNGKEHKTGKWHQIWEERVQPPAFERWTLEDELKLMELKKMEIGMSETAAGQLEKRKKREVVLAVTK